MSTRGPYEPKPEGGMTYQAIAAVLGVSHQRVRQLEKQALAKIRIALHQDLIPGERPVEGWRRS